MRCQRVGQRTQLAGIERRVRGFAGTEFAWPEIGVGDDRVDLDAFVSENSVEYRPAYRPRWTLNLAAQYVSDPMVNDVTVSARVDASYTSVQTAFGKVPAGMSPEEEILYRKSLTVPAQWLVNARVALRGFTLRGLEGEFALWSRNLLNNKKANYLIAYDSLLNGVDYQQARMVGMDFTVRY